MVGTKPEELQEILRAIRDVDASLASRAARAWAAVTIVWGIVGASIFAFYQLVTWNPGPYRAALGPLLAWVWIFPMGVAYAATALAGARLGRVTRDPRILGVFRRHLVVIFLPIALVVALIALGETERVPGMWCVFLAAVIGLRALDCPLSLKGAYTALAVVSLVAGILLLAFPVEWANLAAAAIFGVGLVGLGSKKYVVGE